ncbi:hypothetical protein BTVI_42162 [Pitangus sulphuratus]|nr:hypothetical protein BTVI_42162 [Pitangus sulphuratus]
MSLSLLPAQPYYPDRVIEEEPSLLVAWPSCAGQAVGRYPSLLVVQHPTLLVAQQICNAPLADAESDDPEYSDMVGHLGKGLVKEAQLVQEEVVYLGYEISRGQPSLRTTRKGAICQMPKPDTEILAESNDVTIQVTNVVNPASFLEGRISTEPIEHDCLETTEAVYSSCPDLKEEPYPNVDNWFSDGSSFMRQQISIAGCAVTTTEQFAYENANNDCRRALQSLPKRESCMIAEMKACQNVGSVDHHTVSLATVLAAQLKVDNGEKEKGGCY